MRERPILFTGESVRAIKEGRKTQTRRVVDPKAWTLLDKIREYNGHPVYQCLDFDMKCPYAVGDRLWVREAFLAWDASDGVEKYIYRATDSGSRHDGSWKSPIHMPRWASRITLEITGVRVERLQDISEEDAISEGIVIPDHDRGRFACEWDRINGKRAPWASNPWVWAITFSVIQQQ